MVQFVSASPGLPVMNGIFKVCHWPEPPFLRILPARLFVTTCQKPSAFCLSFLDLLRCFAAVSFRHIWYFFLPFLSFPVFLPAGNSYFRILQILLPFGVPSALSGKGFLRSFLGNNVNLFSVLAFGLPFSEGKRFDFGTLPAA